MAIRLAWFDALVIFCSGLTLFTFGLSQQEVIGFETRFYLFALEMWRHGVTAFPTTYGQAYADYPVTSTLLIYSVAKIMGHLSKLTAVLPSAVAASLTLVVTYGIGKLHSRAWGWYAVFFLLLTNAFVIEARTISPDQYVTSITTLCFYLVYSAQLLKKTKRLFAIPCLFFLGFLFRGPIGLVIPAGVVCVFYLLEKEVKYLVLMGSVALLVLLIGCALLFGVAYNVGGIHFVQDVFRMEVIGRMQGAVLPWYFYFVESLGAYAITYPLALLILLGLGKQLWRATTPELELVKKLSVWAAVIIIGLSIPAGKKVRYVLAFSPALALISASLFALPQKKYYLKCLKHLVYWVCYFLPSVAGVILIYLNNRIPPVFAISYGLITGLFVLQLIVVLVSYFMQMKNSIILASAAFTFLILYIGIVEPINLTLNRTRDFVSTVESLRREHRALLVFYRQNPDALPIKYVVDMQEEEKPLFVETIDELQSIKQPAFVVMSLTHFAELSPLARQQFVVLRQGSIGHEPVVVLNYGFIKKPM